MATIRFYGDLRRFGDKFKLQVRNTREAIRLLTLQIPGLKSHMQKGEYRVRIDGNDVTDLDKQVDFVLHEKAVVHFVPVIQGAKDAGLFQVITGAALLVAGAFTWGATWGPALAMSGGAMLIGGVATMLTPIPEPSKQEAFRESTSFSNLSNLTPQGRPVPLVFGEMMVGSLVIGQGLQTRDVEV